MTVEKQLSSLVNTVLLNRGKKTIENMTSLSSLRNDIGFDSLDLAELTVRIEAEFGIDIFEDGIVNTIGEILEKIEQK